MSIYGSKHFRGCIGIDSVANAVEDATHNAASNFITNCNFVTGLIEKVRKYSLH
ncbi:unnamed protein product, partial [Nesidiocoris tenuis]